MTQVDRRSKSANGPPTPRYFTSPRAAILTALRRSGRSVSWLCARLGKANSFHRWLKRGAALTLTERVFRLLNIRLVIEPQQEHRNDDEQRSDHDDEISPPCVP